MCFPPRPCRGFVFATAIIGGLGSPSCMLLPLFVPLFVPLVLQVL